MTWEFAGTLSMVLCVVTVCIAVLFIVFKGMKGN